MSERPREDEEVLRHCNYCGKDLPISEFSDWAIRRYHKLCRQCSYAKSDAALQLRKSCPVRLLRFRLRHLMHKQGASRQETHNLELADMRTAMSKMGDRSMLSGIGGERLTVARWDPCRPLGLRNLILLTHAESRQHALRQLSDYHPRFVEHVERLLLQEVSSEQDDYPPMSPHTRGFSNDAAAWHLRKFGVVHPVITNKDMPRRTDKVPGRDV